MFDDILGYMEKKEEKISFGSIVGFGLHEIDNIISDRAVESVITGISGSLSNNHTILDDVYYNITDSGDDDNA